MCFVDSMSTFLLSCHERASILPDRKASTVPHSFEVLDLKDCGNPFRFEFNVPIKQNKIYLLSEMYTTTTTSVPVTVIPIFSNSFAAWGLQ